MKISLSVVTALILPFSPDSSSLPVKYVHEAVEIHEAAGVVMPILDLMVPATISPYGTENSKGSGSDNQ